MTWSVQKKSTHSGKKSTKSTPAHQKKSNPQKKSTKKHYGAFKSTHYDPCRSLFTSNVANKTMDPILGHSI